MMSKKQFIKDFKRDDLINDIFVVKFKKPVEQYKNGYKFELRLGDSSKEIMYKFWGPNDEDKVKEIYNQIKKDDVILVKGKLNEWNGSLEITSNDSNNIKVLNKGEYDVNDFIKKSNKSKNEMIKKLNYYIDSIKNHEIKKIIDYYFKNEIFLSKFYESPAAMFVHHGWTNGLLEHTLSILQIAERICEVHPSLDRDLVFCGVLTHDIGKIYEFNVTTSIQMTTQGMLVGHVMIGCEMLTNAMDKLNTPQELRLKLIHMILTHMGEYGSSKTPSFPEALTVHLADNIDARLTQMITLKEEAQTEDDYIYHKDFGNVFLK